MAPRVPLVHPGQYFDGRRVSLARALGVVVVLTIVGVASVYAIGWIFTARVDGTVMVDNPARPSDAFCEDEFFNTSGCDQPREIERNIDPIIRSAVGDVAVQSLWAIPFGWLVVGVLLHAGSWLAGGENGPGASFAVAAWGLLPALVSISIGLVVLYVTFGSVTVTPGGDPAMFREQVFDELGALSAVGTLLGIATAVWGGVIWSFGLKHARGLSGSAALTVAGVVTVLVILGTLV